MSLNLIGGLAAAEAFTREQLAQKERNYRDEQRGYQDQMQQASLSNLPASTRAERSRLDLQSAQSMAGLDTIDARTANETARLGNDRARLGIESDDLDFRAKEQPVLQSIEAQKNRFASQEQDTDQMAQRNGKANERQLAALRQFGISAKTGDKAGALQVANQWASTEALRQGTQGKRFVDVQEVDNGGEAGDQQAYRLVADDGSHFDLPAAVVKHYADQQTTGDYALLQGKDGAIYSGNRKTGVVEQKVAPSATAKAAAASRSGAKSAQLQMVDAMMAANPGLSFDDALDRAKTSTEKPRHQAIMELVGKNLLPGADASAEYQKWAKVYDAARAETRAGKEQPGGKPSNTGQTPMIDPKYQSLFTP